MNLQSARNLQKKRLIDFKIRFRSIEQILIIQWTFFTIE